MRDHNIQEISETGKVPGRFFMLLFMLSTLGQLSVDLYLPSLPAMSQALQASHAAVQLTIAVYLLGIGLSQLVYGPWSDAVGRRKPLLTGVGLTVLGSFLCCVAPNIYILIFESHGLRIGIAVRFRQRRPQQSQNTAGIQENHDETQPPRTIMLYIPAYRWRYSHRKRSCHGHLSTQTRQIMARHQIAYQRANHRIASTRPDTLQ